MKAVFFCEDDYEGCAEVGSEAEFLAFALGFEKGANAYGAGKFSVYLLPRDEAEMIEKEHVGEVMRVFEVVKSS